MALLQEFKTFAVRGNVVDMAVGIIVGAAFGKIVSALVDGVIMPPIGVVLGGVNFRDLSITLKEAVDDKTPAVVLGYGQFIQTIVDFTIIAFAIFLLVKGINALRKAEEATPAAQPPPAPEVLLLTEIRDLLKDRR